MSEVDLLASVLAKTGDIIEGVGPDQLSLPTPCPDYDVSALTNHIVGWVQVFDAGCPRRSLEGDPAAYEVGEDPAGEFRAAAAGLVAGWEVHGFDRQVKLMSGEMPAPMVFNMTVMEYLTHGWDLATATSQPVFLHRGRSGRRPGPGPGDASRRVPRRQHAVRPPAGDRRRRPGDRPFRRMAYWSGRWWVRTILPSTSRPAAPHRRLRPPRVAVGWVS